MGKVKLAICISGFLSKKIDYSFFLNSFHSIKNSFPDDKFVKFYFIAVDSDNRNFIEDYINFVNPCEYIDFEKVVQPNFKISITNKRPETNLLNTYLMFWRINICDALRVSYEIKNELQFDFVVRMRPDLNFFKKIPNFIILAIKYNIINFYLPYFPFKINNAVTDFFAFGTSKKMSYYSLVYEKLDDYISEGVIFHPETFLGVHLKKRFFIFGFPTFLKNRFSIFGFPTICGLYGANSLRNGYR